MNKLFILKNDSDTSKVIDFLNNLSFENALKISIVEHKQTRSSAQNRLMHLWFNHISEHYQQATGEAFTPMAFKELFKRQFLGFDLIDLPDGQVIAKTKSTVSCNTKELTDFLQKIEAWALTEINCHLPHPDDLYWQAMGIK